MPSSLADQVARIRAALTLAVSGDDEPVTEVLAFTMPLPGSRGTVVVTLLPPEVGGDGRAARTPRRGRQPTACRRLVLKVVEDGGPLNKSAIIRAMRQRSQAGECPEYGDSTIRAAVDWLADEGMLTRDDDGHYNVPADD